MENNGQIAEAFTCKFCNQSTPSDLNFCIECDKQIKCLECGNQTYAGKEYCLKCGHDLIKRKDQSAPNHYIRTVEGEGKTYKERTEFSLTDLAVGVIAPVIIPPTIPGLRLKDSSNQANRVSQDVEADFELVDKAAPNTHDSGNAEEQKRTDNATPSSSLSKFFTIDGEMLIPIETDFKGNTWSEQIKYFLIVYIGAHREILGKPVPDRDCLRTAATRISILDPNNFTTYMGKVLKEYVTTLTNGFILNSKGEKEFKKIIQLMEDENAKAGYVYSTKGGQTPSKRNHLSKEEKAAAEGWAVLPADLGELDIRDVKSGKDAGLISIWLITVHLKKAKAITWYQAMHYLKAKFTTIGVTSNAFRKAIMSKDNEKYFQCNSDEEYFLSTDAQAIVEKWISGEINIKKAES